MARNARFSPNRVRIRGVVSFPFPAFLVEKLLTLSSPLIGGEIFGFSSLKLRVSASFLLLVHELDDFFLIFLWSCGAI